MPESDAPQDVRLLRMQLLYGSQYHGPVTTVLLTRDLGTDPDGVLGVLTDAEQHSALVRHPVAITPAAGAPVQLAPDEGDGYVMEVLDGSHVTLALHPPSFPETHYSTVTFLTKVTPDGTTRLTLYQQNVPADLAPAVEAAWRRDYLDPLAARFPT